MIRHLLGPIPAVILSLVLLVTLFLLTSAAQHAKLSGEFYSALLGVNILGIVALSVLIGINLWRLLRQLRSGVLGSRLTLRMVRMIVLLVIVPLSIVYYFSVQFLNKGVDSWFDVRIDEAVSDALLLGSTTLETIKQDALDQLVEDATILEEAENRFQIIPLLDQIRESRGYLELSLYAYNGRIIASSHQDSLSMFPDAPDAGVLSLARQPKESVSLEPLGGGDQQLRIVAPVHTRSIAEQDRLLQALWLLPSRYAKLAESVESASAQYKQMVFFRGPLKFSLILTLTLVALVATLLAVWAAIYLSRRMSAPLRALAEGTRAVAAGDYAKELPVTSSDEFGVLVQSFNNMTRKISHAQSAARRSQREAENQRTYLETVLGHLSSGVLSFDPRHRLRTFNAAVTQILGAEFGAERGHTLARMRKEHPRFESMFAAIENAVDQNLVEWRAEVTVFGKRGAQMLILRGTKLTGRGGYVVVFDDVTDLIQAQRDAAWGEVARRLAHEIKNPLTPIQLSAERLRKKYLQKLDPGDRDTLDRATRTIVHQVESMQEMVNAFSSYAQPVSVNFAELNVNQLVKDVAELYMDDVSHITVRFDLDPDIPALSADAGRIRQVLNNLMINACDSLVDAQDPSVTFTTKNIQDGNSRFVELIMSDNGRGIPGDIMERLFEPYVTTKKKGTGLGLAIVKRIVEEHGGTIWAENVSPRGAQITVRLPVVAPRLDNITDLSIKLATVKNAGGGRR